MDTLQEFTDHIRGNENVDLDCRVSWSDKMEATTSERHILHRHEGDDVFDPSRGDIIRLKIGYSGMHRDWEEEQAHQAALTRSLIIASGLVRLIHKAEIVLLAVIRCEHANA
ncbi:hypothetical protein [Roseobacter sp.]|uniref:hypothetical protein n=1 Tax=Roseobacter sp. TaxID=1907202 RepID=UPI0032999ECE